MNGKCIIKFQNLDHKQTNCSAFSHYQGYPKVMLPAINHREVAEYLMAPANNPINTKILPKPFPIEMHCIMV